jgi:hypothetical protein
MKARMKKLMSVQSMAVLVILIASGFALPAARGPASIQGQVDLNTFSGTATVTIGGVTFSGSVQVIPTGPIVESEDGVLHFPEVVHVFDLGDQNTLVTTGKEVADPVNPFGLYTLNGYMKITSATGIFEGASGELSVHGELDWSVGQATFEARGAISR